jgi:DNA primase
MKFNNSQKIAFVKRVFGGGVDSSDGINITVKCINKKCTSVVKGKYKFAIRVDTDQAHCWVCGFKLSGSLYPALKSIGTNEDIKEYFEKYAVSKRDIDKFSEDESDEPEKLFMPEGFKLLYYYMHTRQGQKIYGYLKDRGIEDRKIWKQAIGFSDSLMLKDRVIIPSFDMHGDLNYYVSRSLDGSFPKYKLADCHKQDIIFNEIFIDWNRELTIVEGPFDLLKSNENSTCLLGTSLNENFKLFWNIIKSKTPVILALDADAAEKQDKIAKKLMLYDIPVKIMNTKDYEDVGAMSKKEFEHEKRNAKTPSSIDFIKSKIRTL